MPNFSRGRKKTKHKTPVGLMVRGTSIEDETRTRNTKKVTYIKVEGAAPLETKGGDESKRRSAGGA